MTTYTAFTTLSDKSAAEALSEAMENLATEPYGVGVFEVEDGSGTFEVGGYFLEDPDQTDLSILSAAFDARPFVISELPDVDWVAHVRRELSPVTAGRFFLYGSHDADKVPQGVVPLAIDAAMAFGTGHHGTTKGCLCALDRLADQGFVGKNVVDIGCGTAVLAMGAAKIWPDALVLASDIDEVAVETSVANLAFNGMEGRFDCLECAGFDHPALKSAKPFDLIFANILMSPLIALAPDMKESSAPGGYVILSGILNTQADEVVKVYRDYGYAVDDRSEIGEWTTLTLKAPVG